MLLAGVVLLVGFVMAERRVASPLLPLRVVLHRNRGGSYLAVAISAIAMFAVFLFLTYYLQQNLGMSPVMAGVAFLPMVAMIMISSITGNIRLVPRFGPRPLVPTGMALACAGMVYLTGLGPHATYAADVLPVAAHHGPRLWAHLRPGDLHRHPRGEGVRQWRGLGDGQRLPAGRRLDRDGAAVHDRGHRQQELCLLASRGGPNSGFAAQAAVHGYTTAFRWSAIIFAIGAVTSLLLLERGVAVAAPGESVPVVA